MRLYAFTFAQFVSFAEVYLGASITCNGDMPETILDLLETEAEEGNLRIFKKATTAWPCEVEPAIPSRPTPDEIQAAYVALGYED